MRMPGVPRAQDPSFPPAPDPTRSKKARVAAMAPQPKAVVLRQAKPDESAKLPPQRPTLAWLPSAPSLNHLGDRLDVGPSAARTMVRRRACRPTGPQVCVQRLYLPHSLTMQSSGHAPPHIGSALRCADALRCITHTTYTPTPAPALGGESGVPREIESDVEDRDASRAAAAAACTQPRAEARDSPMLAHGLAYPTLERAGRT